MKKSGSRPVGIFNMNTSEKAKLRRDIGEPIFGKNKRPMVQSFNQQVSGGH